MVSCIHKWQQDLSIPAGPYRQDANASQFYTQNIWNNHLKWNALTLM